MGPELSAALVRDAAERIRPLARHTPVYLSRGLNREAGLEVHFKCENLQRGGAFKIRGASNFILSIPDEDLPRGVVAGCATIAKGIDPDIRLFGVEPERANDTYLSFQAGHPVEIPPQDTIADGLRTLKPGKFTFPVLQRHVEGILLVSEDEIRTT